MACSCTENTAAVCEPKRPQESCDPETQTIGNGVRFQRIRRITGYLVGTIDRFNDAKRSEEHDRVKHGI